MKRKALSKKKEARLKIERQEQIKEVRTKSYEIVRLSRIKYYGNKYNFIDIRTYQRGFDSSENEIYYPTSKGVQFREDLFLKLVNELYLQSLDKQFNGPDQ